MAQRLGMNRVAMRRIEVEVARADEHVLWIRRFEDRHPAGPQYPQRFVEQPEQQRTRKMLDDVNRGQRTEAPVGQLAQSSERVANRGVESQLTALFHRCAIAVDAGGRESVRARDFEQ